MSQIEPAKLKPLSKYLKLREKVRLCRYSKMLHFRDTPIFIIVTAQNTCKNKSIKKFNNISI